MPRFHVQRSTEIQADPQKVYETVADFGTWTTWSPWLCADPDARVDVSQDASSVGAIYAWQGELVGQGEIEHQRLEPGRLIEDEIRFIKPFRSRSQVSFELEPAGDGTRLTWHMRGALPWFLFWMLPQTQVFIGMDYERGLRMLKEWIETGQILSRTSIRGIESVGPLQMAGVRKTCSIHDIGPSMEAALDEAKRNLSAHDLPTDGEVISVYHKFDAKAGVFDYTSGFILPESGNTVPPDLSSWSIPSVRALVVEHIGSYEHLGNGWSAGHQYVRYKKLKQSNNSPFEICRNDPQHTPAAELRCEIYLPLRS
jgi:predicted transcriptional regulator YdeE